MTLKHMPAYVRLRYPFSCRRTRGRKRPIIDKFERSHTRSSPQIQVLHRQPLYD